MVINKFINAHLKVAETYANLSSAKKLKVGAIVVKDNRVISIGYNGTPSGWDNTCEDLISFSPWPDEQKPELHSTHTFKTRPEVIHAEANAIAKLARSVESGLDAEMFVTHSPCMECAKLIYSAGIKNVYYRDSYRDSSGIDFLKKCGVLVQQVKEKNV